MAYSTNLGQAAERHFAAAEILKPTHRHDVAGYLYGIAAECAIKQLMRQSGLFPRIDAKRGQGDPYFAHFPDLKNLLRNRCQGRNAMVLHHFVNDQRFMQNWDITMRYAAANQIARKDVDHWRSQAAEVIRKMRGN